MTLKERDRQVALKKAKKKLIIQKEAAVAMDEATSTIYLENSIWVDWGEGIGQSRYSQNENDHATAHWLSYPTCNTRPKLLARGYSYI